MSKRLEFVLRDSDTVLSAIMTLTKIKTDRHKPDFVCVIKPFVRDRTEAQNKLFHKWVAIIASDSGADVNWVKNEIKRKFLGTDQHFYKHPETGEKCIAETIRKTSDLNVKEMTHFMNEVEAWANVELGIVLPIPDDLRWAMENDRSHGMPQNNIPIPDGSEQSRQPNATYQEDEKS